MPTFDELPNAEQADIGERISAALIGHFHGQAEPGVTLDEVITINAANHRIIGEIDGVPFCCENGDIGGFRMVTWGAWPEPQPVVPPDPIVLGPCDIPHGVDRRKYVQDFASRPQVQEAVRARRYDLLFSPTDRIRAHYNALAAKLGGCWMHKSERDALMADPQPKVK